MILPPQQLSYVYFSKEQYAKLEILKQAHAFQNLLLSEKDI